MARKLARKLARKKPARGKTPLKKRKSARTTPSDGFLLFMATRLLAALVFVILTILLYLNLEIQRPFNRHIQSQPAHVYTRPLPLTVGTVFPPIQLAQTLTQSGYHRVDRLTAPGDFVHARHTLDVFIRPFDNGIIQQPAKAVRIAFDGNTIAHITDHATARGVTQITLEPLLIGSLQLGPHKDRISLKLHEMPELLIKALLVMEDRNFESHIGIDPKGIARALWSNLKHGKTTQGGSTLTQQLVKNIFLSPKPTLSRKATEALMAMLIELRFSKAAILELYLNEIFLGQSGNRAVHGFALASEYYFGRSLDQLRPHEIALLVSIIPAPSFYNPRKHPERALKRRNLVLQTLAETRTISPHSAITLAALPLAIIEHNTDSTSSFPAYLDYLHRQLRQYYSAEVLRTNGLKLYTSLDTGIQNIAQNGLSETLTRLEQQHGIQSGTLQGAVIVVEPKQGEILALVGGRVKGYSGFNRALDAERPIGSLVKPAVYLTALEQAQQFSLVTLLNDSPLTIRPQNHAKNRQAWSPQNYDKKFRGMIPLYQGLIHSYNVPTVRLGLKVGVDSVIDTMHHLGIERDIANYPSTLLGASQHTPLEIAQMYQTLANQGIRIPLRSIQSIYNHRGKMMAKFPLSGKRVIDQNSAYLIDFALQQVVLQGTARGLSRSNAGLGIRGKTGTTDNFRDSWFVGYNDNLLAVVWVGGDNNRPIKLSGSSGAMRVWENIMSNINLRPSAQRHNDNIVFSRIDPKSGLIANNRCAQNQLLPFVRGSQPQAFAPCSGLASGINH